MPATVYRQRHFMRPASAVCWSGFRFCCRWLLGRLGVFLQRVDHNDFLGNCWPGRWLANYQLRQGDGGHHSPVAHHGACDYGHKQKASDVHGIQALSFVTYSIDN